MTSITRHQGLSMATMEDMKSFAAAAYCSGFLDKGDKNTAIAKAIMKIQYGAELGLGPMQSIQGVQVIQGKPTLSAGLIATLVKRSERYNYRITEHSDETCTIIFYEMTHLAIAGKGQPHQEWKECGTSTFAIKDAIKANLTKNPTWKTYARNMLFARALSNGARWYCSDVFAGSVYTPEEMESTQDDYPTRTMEAIMGNETPDVIDEDGMVVE